MVNEKQQDANATDFRQRVVCLVCSRDRTVALSLREAIKESRQWIEAHPHAGGDFPSSNNLKQMLTEACDFAETMLDCITIGRTAPAYANFRCLLERTHFAQHFLSRENVTWEYQSMARRQEALSRLLNHVSPEEQGWIKEHLSAIRRWNASPDSDGKPTTMQRHTRYAPDLPEMPSHMRDWYEVSSLYVHPTYMWEQNIGRILSESEMGALTSMGHGYFCLVSFATRGVDLAVSIAMQDPECQAMMSDLRSRLVGEHADLTTI